MKYLVKKILVGIGCLTLLLTASLAVPSSSAQAATNSSSTVQTQISAAQKADRIIALAKSLMGKVHYRFGVNDPAHYTFDCSSFTKYIFASQGVNLKWGSYVQSRQGTRVSKSNLKKGDLVFFSVATPGKINHVGVYMGNGKFIHNTTGKVYGLAIGDLNSPSYQKRYITATRVLK